MSLSKFKKEKRGNDSIVRTVCERVTMMILFNHFYSLRVWWAWVENWETDVTTSTWRKRVTSYFDFFVVFKRRPRCELAVNHSPGVLNRDRLFFFFFFFFYLVRFEMSDGLRLCAVSLEVVSLRCVHVQTSKPASTFNREGVIKAVIWIISGEDII